MKLTLTKRPAQIGGSINTRTEKHGEENVPGIDIPITEVMLTKEELNALLQDPDAHDAFFTDERGDQLEPRFVLLSAFSIAGKFSGAKVTLAPPVGDGEALVLKPAKVSKMVLVPQVGGLTAMSCTIQGNPPEHLDVIGLLNQKTRISILNGEREAKVEQPELDLTHKDQASEGEGSGIPADESPKRRGGRRARN
jgi:hypothetical protein